MHNAYHPSSMTQSSDKGASRHHYRVSQLTLLIFGAVFVVATLLVSMYKVNNMHRRYAKAEVVLNKTWMEEIEVAYRKTSFQNTTNGSYDVLESPFSHWPQGVPLPCFPVDDWDDFDDSSISKGFIYIRPSKAASTLMAGVNTRIARNVARRQDLNDLCCHNWRHSKGKQHGFVNETEFFLWTMIRDPFMRAVDEFFHLKVSRSKKIPTVGEYLNFILDRSQKDYFVRFLATEDWREEEAENIMKRILSKYNFIGVVERLDESLVVLSMLLRIELGDMLYLTSNLGDWYDKNAYDGRCRETPSFATSNMKAISKTKEWKELAKIDNLLLQYVNTKLDHTIGMLGAAHVKRNLETFRAMKQKATKHCLVESKMHCFANGTRNKGPKSDCVHEGTIACAMSCLDELAADYGTF